MKRQIKAFLISKKIIKVDVFPLTNLEDATFYLYINNEKKSLLKIKEHVKTHHEHYFLLELEEEIVLGKLYQIYSSSLDLINLNLSFLASLEEFDTLYAYDGHDLGATYTPLKTTFVLWAPLSSKVTLKYFYRRKWHFVQMKREEKGIYRVIVKGNLDGAKYLYQVTNNGVEVEVSDPYAKLSLLNNEASVVCNFKRVDFKLNDQYLPPFNKYVEAIIYEGHVRDLTISKDTNIEHKGTFKGLSEKGRQTKDGYPAGFDYIKSLGITHLQLLPIFDYQTVDEKEPLKSYNWGYDPAQYFVLEGSYGSRPKDPYSRLRDFKRLVAAFHKEGIRIIMDTVFNHVYEWKTSVFEKVVPNYYFRFEKDGRRANRSGCGNDLATERKMVRKLIVDASLYYVKELGVDGFRHDLMGLIDLETIMIIRDEVLKIKKDFLFLGEGWQMADEVNSPFLYASLSNAFKMPEIAFFNDWYRDILKGPTHNSDMTKAGYLTNEEGLERAFSYAFLGSSHERYLTRRFLNPNQSINYVECHDNETLFDKINATNEDESINERLERQKLFNAVVGFSFGVPFFHMGQEIGLSKNDHQNSYMAGDHINMMDYDLLDERMANYQHFKDVLKVRKKFSFFKEDDPKKILKLVNFKYLKDGAIKITYNLQNYETPFLDFIMFINPSSETIYYDLDDYYQLLFSNSGEVYQNETYVKHGMIKPRTLVILVLNKK